MALNGLRFAERGNFAARIDWNERSLYFDPEYGENVWDYYFEQSNFDFGDREFDDGAVRPNFNLPYRPGAEDLVPYSRLSVKESVHIALGRFCRPKAVIVDKVEQFVASRFRAEGMLGVHVRLTDAARAFEGRKAVDLQHFLDAVETWLDGNGGKGGVFLATDDERVIDCFQRKFPGYVSFQDCTRSSDGTSLHGHYDAGVNGRPFKKGLEALIDALLLARCDHLIRSHSRLTCYSICVNPNLSYTDLTRIHLGIDRFPWLRGEVASIRDRLGVIS